MKKKLKTTDFIRNKMNWEVRNRLKGDVSGSFLPLLNTPNRS